jgi:hypothetical protein
MNTTETDLIFERYTQTKINESYETSIAGRLKKLLQTNAAAIQKASRPSGFQTFGRKHDQRSIGQTLDAVQKDIEQAGHYGEFLADLKDAHRRLQMLLIQRTMEMQDLGLLQPLQSLANELRDIMKDWKRASAEDEDNESSEGAVNLLEQLKAEVPELEDKINQVLEKVFDAVDILKQESYADDPQLQKVYASLIQGDF